MPAIQHISECCFEDCGRNDNGHSIREIFVSVDNEECNNGTMNIILTDCNDLWIGKLHESDIVNALSSSLSSNTQQSLKERTSEWFGSTKEVFENDECIHHELKVLVSENKIDATLCVSKVNEKASLRVAKIALKALDNEAERKEARRTMFIRCTQELEANRTSLAALNKAINELRGSHDILATLARKDANAQRLERDALITNFVKILNEKKHALAKLKGEIQ